MSFQMIDADSHYYESDDAFTRHLPKALVDRGLRIDRSNGGKVMLSDDRLGFFSVAVGDHVGPPGMLKAYFRNKGEFVFPNANGLDAQATPAFTNRDARLTVMDDQRIAAALMLPTWGVGVEPEIRAHRELLGPSITAFNRWVEEEWGFTGRIVSAAILSLADVTSAVVELDRLAGLGCRAVVIAPGPVDDRSPADPHFDPIWARIEAHEMFAIHHIGASPFCELYATHWGERAHPPSHRHSALEMYYGMGERPISDTWAALYFHNLFGRFPRLQIASIEWGASWLPAHIDRLTKLTRAAVHKDSWRFGKPELSALETFRASQWIVPYYEDDISGLIDVVGDTRVLAGSDYPHPEGLSDPNEFAEELIGLSDRSIRNIMHDNAAGLLGPALQP